jgi:hypothetical protein
MDEFMPLYYDETEPMFYNENLEFLLIGTIFSSLLAVMALFCYKRMTNVFVYKKVIVGNVEHPNKIVFTISPDNFERYYKNKISDTRGSVHHIDDMKSKYNDIPLNTYRSYRANYEIVKKIMRNNIVESVIIQNMLEPKDYYELYTMFLMNNIPLEVVILRDSDTSDDGDYSVKGVLSAGSRIYHNYQIKDCVVDNHRIYYIYNTQKDCDGFKYIKTIENEYMTLRYYRNDTSYGISIEKNDLGLKIRDLLYISGFVN